MSDILKRLHGLMETRREEIEAWFADAWQQTPPYFYTSVDLRHSGFKLAPVDTNLFPAGFNNLSKKAESRAIEAAKQTVTPGEKVLVVPEGHTRNLKYLDSLAVLTRILQEAGAEVQMGSLIAGLEEPLELTSAAGDTVVLRPLTRAGNQLQTVEGFVPDKVLVNNDMTDGAPELLKDIAQPVMPPVGMGWYRRRKSEHFRSYARVAEAFGEAFDLDPWFISTDIHHCGSLNFMEMEGVECVARGVEKLIFRLKERYAEHGIDDEPYVFIKADSGTYGMGIMTVKSAEEVFEMNRKARKKMHAIKGGVSNTEVVIQEGVPTADLVEGAPSEPMIYLVNGQAVGGAYRVHETRDARSNLNAVGMRFATICDDEQDKKLCMDAIMASENAPACDFCSFSLVSRLAALAAVREEYEEGEVEEKAAAV